MKLKTFRNLSAWGPIEFFKMTDIFGKNISFTMAGQK